MVAQVVVPLKQDHFLPLPVHWAEGAWGSFLWQDGVSFVSLIVRHRDIFVTRLHGKSAREFLTHADTAPGGCCQQEARTGACCVVQYRERWPLLPRRCSVTPRIRVCGVAPSEPKISRGCTRRPSDHQLSSSRGNAMQRKRQQRPCRELKAKSQERLVPF
jgi:hypothetical protein